MVQIKVSVAFVLAAAAIAPVVAQPIREGREFTGHVGHRRHRIMIARDYAESGIGPPHGLGFLPNPVVLPRGPASPRAFTREFTESDDMFERDFEDAEFDARDFDDELYLD